MSEMPTLGAEYDFELFVSTPFGEESYEMRVTYNHYPQVKWGLEVEPCEEYFEVENIEAIFCGAIFGTQITELKDKGDNPKLRRAQASTRRARARTLALIALEMHLENPDQLHSILGDL